MNTTKSPVPVPLYNHDLFMQLGVDLRDPRYFDAISGAIDLATEALKHRITGPMAEYVGVVRSMPSDLMYVIITTLEDAMYRVIDGFVDVHDAVKQPQTSRGPIPLARLPWSIYDAGLYERGIYERFLEAMHTNPKFSVHRYEPQELWRASHLKTAEPIDFFSYLPATWCLLRELHAALGRKNSLRDVPQIETFMVLLAMDVRAAIKLPSLPTPGR